MMDIIIRITLPFHLRHLAGIGPAEEEVALEATSSNGQITQRNILDALEAQYPMLRGTIRDHVTHERRAFLRFFVGTRDWSHESPDAELPNEVATGDEPFRIVGAIAGG